MYHLKESFGFLIFRADLKLKNAFLRKMREFELTPDHWMILNRLCEKDGINQTELAEKTYKDPASLTRILNRMVKKGWVNRQPSTDDRRSFLIHITDQGKLIQREAAPKDLELLSELTSHMTEEEMYLLRKLVKKLVDGIEVES